MLSMINWHLETRKLSQLKDHPKNPRQLSTHDAAHLTVSIDKFGLIDKPIINVNGEIIGGHQRKKILKKLAIKEVQCWVPDRELTQKEVDELNIRLNRNTGEFDFDILANEWEITDLLDWGFEMDDFQLGKTETIDEILLPSDEKEFKSVTFTLTNEQAEFVERCIGISKSMGEFVETKNENINGNALVRICELWFGEHGRG